VIGNEISGSDYNTGVLLIQSGSGNSDARVLGNLVVGQSGTSGNATALGISPSGGTCTFELINNTLADDDAGIVIDGRDDLGASWSGVVANNVVARMARVGIQIGQPTQTTGFVTEEHNLFFEVPLFDYAPGPGSVLQDPRFVGNGNYRLTFSSAARNAGNDALVPSDLVVDLDGGLRRVGHVDMGAYESTITVASPLLFSTRACLHPNFPNPFNPSTTIQYELPQPERVRVAIFDASGRLVRRLLAGSMQSGGLHSCLWDGRSADGVVAPSGIYFYRLEAGDFIATRRMVLAR